MLIASRNNPTIKQIRALQQRKIRDQSGLFLIEGIRHVIEALETPERVESVVFAPDLLISPAGLDAIERARRHPQINLIEVTSSVFQSLAQKDNPAGVSAVVRQQWQSLDAVLSQDNALWVALVEVSDPGNLGTILRTCDAVGADGVILIGATVDPFHPTALRASMGAIFTNRLVRVDFDSFSQWKGRSGFTVIGAADNAPVDYRSIEYAAPLILLMGSERQGLSTAQKAVCDALVSIPMIGKGDSLNLSVATGVLLYEIFNHMRR
jgi:TrmH family RNA methyltransferase